ncbi:MAG: hypothetical protein RIC06_00645 [Cyclobacteriaceae bacterium]
MKMDIQTEKLRLIEWIAGLNDPKTLNEFITLKKQREEDWWDTIGDDEREEIQEGLGQADRGEVVDHKTAMEKYQKWL